MKVLIPDESTDYHIDKGEDVYLTNIAPRYDLEINCTWRERLFDLDNGNLTFNLGISSSRIEGIITKFYRDFIDRGECFNIGLNTNGTNHEFPIGPNSALDLIEGYEEKSPQAIIGKPSYLHTLPDGRILGVSYPEKMHINHKKTLQFLADKERRDKEIAEYARAIAEYKDDDGFSWGMQ